jgi:glycosyltransferase involved in cell wall biosynthesis
MRILFFTHRFGKDVVGGAELHLWNLAEQMARMGCQIDVATAREKDIAPFMRFGLTWSSPHGAAREEIAVDGAAHPIRVFRFPVRHLPKAVGAICQKHLQHRWEREELAMEPAMPLPAPPGTETPLLLTGWHLPEPVGGRWGRWTTGRAVLQLPATANASLHLQGAALKRVTIQLEHAGRSRVVFRGKGDFHVPVKLDDHPPGLAALTVEPTWRPLRDTRTLGVMVTQISLSNHGRIELTPFNSDHRTLRALDHKKFIEAYLARAARRPRHYGWLFDQLRGPHCPGMAGFAKAHAAEYDWVIGGILPFDTIPALTRIRRRHPFRLALLPLFHVDDDFYYWRHYVDALKEADVCLANSWFSREIFFPALGATSIVAGAGVDERLFRRPGIDGARFRKKYGIKPDEKIVLSVGRKNAGKRYQAIIHAVDDVQYRRKCRLVLVGPDEDRLAITSPNCLYVGTLPQEVLLDAYDACDVFCLMSESESFGMVFVEAWMREKPVVGNRNCAPVSYLIRHGETGLLASDRRELEDCLVDLLNDPQKCKAYGQAGLVQVRREHTWPVVAQRVLDCLESMMGGGERSGTGTGP